MFKRGKGYLYKKFISGEPIGFDDVEVVTTRRELETSNFIIKADFEAARQKNDKWIVSARPLTSRTLCSTAKTTNLSTAQMISLMLDAPVNPSKNDSFHTILDNEIRVGHEEWHNKNAASLPPEIT